MPAYIEDQEDELIEICEKLGYGLDINYLRGYVEITNGSRKPQRYKDVFSALRAVRSKSKGR